VKVQAELGKLSENCNAGNTQVIMHFYLWLHAVSHASL